MDNRKDALVSWTRHCLEAMTGRAAAVAGIDVVSGDASFRRYFRIRLAAPLEGDEESLSAEIAASLQESQFLLVDAPPTHEDCRKFVSVANLLRSAGLVTPRVLQVDYEQGFMLLQDFGDALYLPALQDPENVDALYGAAMDAIIALQAHDCSVLPPYDRGLLRAELGLFDEWFCQQLLGLSLNRDERALLDRTWRFLEDAALAQPQVGVHRDYHSRNLMIRDIEAPGAAPGVIDFQDAVLGANTYDLVSLLRDCYIVWPQARVRAWVLEFRAKAVAKGLIQKGDGRADAAFLRDFDLMGLQRHIKVIGIFCRLYLRDGKRRYMADVPLVIDYVRKVAVLHPEMNEFVRWFDDRVLPVATEKLAALPGQEAAS